MAITLRQTYTAPSKTIGNVSVQAGDLIWVGFDITGSMIETNCADNAAGGSNVYDPPDSGFELYGDHVKVFYAKAKATETLTITVTTANSSGPRIFVHVYSGCDAALANVLDGSTPHVDTSSATAHATADLTTTNADDLLLTFWIQCDTSTTISENGTGFTRRITVGGMGTFDRTVSATGTYHEDVTSTVATRYGSYIMAFRAAPSGTSGSGGTTQAVQSSAGTATIGTGSGISGAGGTSQPVQQSSGSAQIGQPPTIGIPLVKAATNGIFDGSRVKLERVFMPTWGDTSPGSVVLFEGNVSGVEPSSTQVVLHIKSELERLNIALPKYVYQPACGHTLYSTGCGISKAAWTVTGVVGAGATKVIVPSNRGEAAEYFTLGVLTMTSGANRGARRAVRAYAGGSFTLAMPLPEIPQPGDTFTVAPGCDHTMSGSGCARFNNLNRFRGFPWIPRPETAR